MIFPRRPGIMEKMKGEPYGTACPFPRYRHDGIELTPVLSGEMEYRVNGAVYVPEGEGLFRPAEKWEEENA